MRRSGTAGLPDVDPWDLRQFVVIWLRLAAGIGPESSGHSLRATSAAKTGAVSVLKTMETTRHKAGTC
jgi:hypothetical protein